MGIIDKSEGYVGLCEGSATDQKYNSADYPTIAEALNCELTDLLPPADWKVDSLSDPVFVKRVLQGIKASRYADKLEGLISCSGTSARKTQRKKPSLKKCGWN